MQEREQFLSRMKSQLFTRIDLFHPSGTLALLRLTGLVDLNYKRTPHNESENMKREKFRSDVQVAFRCNFGDVSTAAKSEG
jgi:hypothetical protein